MKGPDLAVAGSWRRLAGVGVLVAGLLVGVLVILLAGAKDASAHGSDLDENCEATEVPVTVAGEAPTDENFIYGELCTPKGKFKGTTPETVMLTVHGITYGTFYNDFPYKSKKYSLVDFLNKKGYATFNIDRIGMKNSSHPPAQLVDVQANANTVNQVITQLKDGDVLDTQFDHVITVGHSYGSITNFLAASKAENEADATIGTGYSGTGYDNTQGGEVFQGADPVEVLAGTQVTPGTEPNKWGDDDRADVPQSPGYLGARGVESTGDPQGSRDDADALYFLPNADPKVVEVDSTLSDTTTQQELDSFQVSRTEYPMIEIPVFEVNGEFDRIFCNFPSDAGAEDPNVCDSAEEIEQNEEPLYSNACFDASKPIARTGHDQNLHLSAPQTYKKILKFANASVGRNGENIEKYRANCEVGPGGP